MKEQGRARKPAKNLATLLLFTSEIQTCWMSSVALPPEWIPEFRIFDMIPES